MSDAMGTLNSFGDRIEEDGTENEKMIFQTYLRMVNADATTTQEYLASLTGVDSLTMAALHCRDHGVPNEYGARLLSEAEAGRYQATHALLSYMWLLNNGCDADVSPDQRARILESVRAIIASELENSYDLKIEATAFLLSAGQEKLIPADWIDLMLDLQNDDGGWTAAPWWPGGMSVPHTSMSALWALLAVRDAETNFTSMLPE